jgi:hypothetical protein
MPASDTLATGLRDLNFHDVLGRPLVLDGSWLLDGREILDGVSDSAAGESVTMGMRHHRFLDGTWLLDGSVELNSMVLIPLE